MLLGVEDGGLLGDKLLQAGLHGGGTLRGGLPERREGFRKVLGDSEDFPSWTRVNAPRVNGMLAQAKARVPKVVLAVQNGFQGSGEFRPFGRQFGQGLEMEARHGAPRGEVMLAEVRPQASEIKVGAGKNTGAPTIGTDLKPRAPAISPDSADCHRGRRVQPRRKNRRTGQQGGFAGNFLERHVSVFQSLAGRGCGCGGRSWESWISRTSAAIC